jgi:superfamily II DNA helicase RecQ
MPFKFFTIPIRDGAAAEDELNAFLRSHRVLTIDRRWLEQGADTCWCLCVDYVEMAGHSPDTTSRRNRGKDYKEVLDAEEFTRFAQLRELRKEIGQREGVPVYAIFTNEQLAQMVQRPIDSQADLETIVGVGKARVEKYGDEFLRLLKETKPEGQHEADGESV